MRLLLPVIACGCVLYGTNALGQVGSSATIPFGGGGVSGSLSISAGQGFSRGITTSAPVVTVQNGIPGFAFGGTVSPFVTGVFPVVSQGPQANRPAGMSPIQRMLWRGDIRLERDPSGGTRLILGESPSSIVASDGSKPSLRNEPVKPTSQAANPFRRGIEKYAGSKR